MVMIQRTDGVYDFHNLIRHDDLLFPDVFLQKVVGWSLSGAKWSAMRETS